MDRAAFRLPLQLGLSCWQVTLPAVVCTASTGPLALLSSWRLPSRYQVARAPSFGYFRARSVAARRVHACICRYSGFLAAACRFMLALWWRRVGLRLVNFVPTLSYQRLVPSRVLLRRRPCLATCLPLPWRFALASCLAVRPGAQRLWLSGGGSLSPACRLDAGGSLGQDRCSARFRQRSPSFVSIGTLPPRLCP
jgi:hypothetical protein